MYINVSVRLGITNLTNYRIVLCTCDWHKHILNLLWNVSLCKQTDPKKLFQNKAPTGLKIFWNAIQTECSIFKMLKNLPLPERKHYRFLNLITLFACTLAIDCIYFLMGNILFSFYVADCIYSIKQPLKREG